MRKLTLVVILVALFLVSLVPALAQERPSLPELLTNDEQGRFTTLLAAVEAAGLVETLSGEGPFTVFAPTNAAFDAALDYLGLEAEDLLEDTETLTSVLLYHVVPGTFRSTQLFGGNTLDTALEGETVATAENAAGRLVVNDITISDVDNFASNGVVHAIDNVLLPPALAEAAAANRAFIRVAHLSPDAGAVDVWINGEVSALTGVTLGTISDWIEVPARAYRFGVAAEGEEPDGAILRGIAPGTRTTIAAVGFADAGQLSIEFLTEDYSPIADGQARVGVFHAIPGAPVVDIRANDGLLIGVLGFPGSLGDNDGFDTRDVFAGIYDIEVVAQGTTTPAIISVEDLELVAGNYYFVAAILTRDGPTLATAVTDLTPDAE